MLAYSRDLYLVLATLNTRILHGKLVYHAFFITEVVLLNKLFVQTFNSGWIEAP